MAMDVVALVHVAKVRSASDLHMSVGSPPMLRVHGDLVPAMEDAPDLTDVDMQDAFNQLTNEKEKAEFEANKELDFGYSVEGLTRLRCNAARQKGTISLAMRLIAQSIPDIDTLHIPEV